MVRPHFVHVQDVKYVLPTDSIIAKLPNYDNFGRKTKLRLNPDNIPDLHWELATLANTITSTTSSYSTPKSDLISIKTITAVPHSCLLNKTTPFRNIYPFIYKHYVQAEMIIINLKVERRLVSNSSYVLVIVGVILF